MIKTTATVVPTEASCDSCGGGPFALRPSGKSFVSRHKDNGDYCLGRPVTEQAKPAPGKRTKQETETERADCRACQRRDIALKAGKLVIHKDLAKGVRCVGSLTPPSEVKANAPQPKAQPKPKAEKAKAAPKVALTPEAKAMAKAAKFGLDVKQFGWRTEYEVNKTDTHPVTGESIASVTAVAKRGQRDDTEVMRITWWGAACIGSDDRITWQYKGRTIAVRNAKACRDRAAIAHEVLTAESNRIATRAAAPKGKKGKGGLSPLPFDPATVSDEQLLEQLVGRVLTWKRKLDDAQQSATAKPGTKIRIQRPKSNPDERNVTVMTTEGSKTFALSRLVSIG